MKKSKKVKSILDQVQTFEIKNIDDIFGMGCAISRVFMKNDISYPIPVKQIIREMGGLIINEKLNNNIVSEIKQLTYTDDFDFKFEIKLNEKYNENENISLATQIGYLFLHTEYMKDNYTQKSHTVELNSLKYIESLQFALAFLMQPEDLYKSIKQYSTSVKGTVKLDAGKVADYYGVRIDDVISYARSLKILPELDENL